MAKWSLEEVSELFKIKYGQITENVYNSANVMLGRTKKNYDFVGKKKEMPTPLTFAGGVGSGSLPRANKASYGDVVLFSHKMYARVLVDREGLKASSTDEGAFVKFTKEPVKKGVESFMRNMSRALFHDGSGSLGTITAVVVLGGGSYRLTISDATWNEANWEERDFVNISAGNPDLFEVMVVLPLTKQVEVHRFEGAHVPIVTDVVFMQGSEGNDPTGLKNVLEQSVGDLYNVPVQRRWQAKQIDAGGAGIVTDMINELMLGVEKQCGKTPNLIMTSNVQFRKILNQLEDQKRYMLDPRAAELKGKISFKGVEFMSSMGPVGIFWDRFIRDDKLMALNDDFISIEHRPDFGWFDDDGTIFLRAQDEDAYEARYGGYLEFYAIPSFQGVITGLAT